MDPFGVLGLHHDVLVSEEPYFVEGVRLSGHRVEPIDSDEILCRIAIFRSGPTVARHLGEPSLYATRPHLEVGEADGRRSNLGNAQIAHPGRVHPDPATRHAGVALPSYGPCVPTPRIDVGRSAGAPWAWWLAMRGGALWSHEAEFAAHLTSASRAREFVRIHLAGHDMGYLSDEIQLVVSELATNAMVHARTPFTVSLAGFELTVVLEVQDGSPSGARLVRARVLDTSGRGIAIVDATCRDWGVLGGVDGGKSVWAEFDRR